MQRLILEEARIHEGAKKTLSTSHRDIVEEVDAAARAHDVVVVGMAGNPFVRKARKKLASRGLPFTYLEYGSYASSWRRRNALKMWTGWPTFPMVFVKGAFVGGCAELSALLASGELDALLAAERR